LGEIETHTQEIMNTRLGHVAYMNIGIRISSFITFCNDFNLKLEENLKPNSNKRIGKDCHMTENFVYFLLENKTFIKIYYLDKYVNKSPEIICNKTGQKIHVVENYLKEKSFKLDEKYPYRYLSSYKIDFDLGGKYDFLKYNSDHFYEGNFEYRRRLS
jgi:hypothetical protein